MKILYFLRIVLIKLKLGKKLIFFNGAFKSNFDEISNVTATNGKIYLIGKIYMKKNSKLGVNHGGKIIIKDGTFFNYNSICASLGTIIIGENCSIGPNVCIYDHNHAFNENGKISNKFKIGKIIIGNNVWIGAGAIILMNTEIGDNSIIGAGTIVSGKIACNSIVKSDRNINIVKLVTKK